MGAPSRAFRNSTVQVAIRDPTVFVVFHLSDYEAARIRVRLRGSNTQIIVGIRGEVDTFVAAIALGFVEIDIHAANLCRVHGCLVAGLVATVGGVAGQQRAFKRRDGLADLVDGNFGGTECRLEAVSITGNPAQLRHRRQQTDRLSSAEALGCAIAMLSPCLPTSR